MSETPTEAKEKINGPVRIRPATEADVSFIFDSWLRSYRGSKATWGIKNPVYYGSQHKLIEGLLRRCTVLVACNNADSGQLYSYVVTETVEGCLVVHYAYTKEAYRMLGLVGTMLKQIGFAKNKPTFYTHRTAVAERIERQMPLVYNPYLAYSAYDLGQQFGKEPNVPNAKPE
jgi:hypothetical protein